MRALVTGAGGMIGGHLVKRLVEEGHDVVATDVKEPGEWLQWQNYHVANLSQFDLRYSEECWEIFSFCFGIIDTIFHLASNMGGVGHITNPNSQAQIIYDNTIMDFNMLEAAREAGVKKFFYSSSACVYPQYLMTTADYTSLEEGDVYPADPNELYGLG